MPTWYCVVAIPDSRTLDCNFQPTESVLIGSEVGCYVASRAPKRKAEFLAGRIAAKRAIAAALGLKQGATPEIRKGANGAPTVAGHRDLTVSISHSSGIAVALVALSAIGIDVERNEARCPALARWFLSEAERNEIATESQVQWDRAVTRLWTRKEAASKVGGWGGRLEFNRLDCRHSIVEVRRKQVCLASASSREFAVSVAFELPVGVAYG